jgi:hypothetical protein
MSTRAPFHCGDHRGFRYAELPPALEEHLPRWLVDGAVEGGEPLTGGRVWRFGAFAVKLFPPARGWRARLRGSRAVRSADLAVRLRPIRTPAPLVALRPERDRATRSELLVLEFVEGRPLHLLWRDDPHAVAAFPGFLAKIARRGVLLGDFHPNNALWDGAHWVLLDLDGIRHRLHRVHARRLIEVQWARTWLSVERDPAVRELFDAFLREARIGWRADEAWARVEDRANRWRQGGG